MDYFMNDYFVFFDFESNNPVVKMTARISKRR